MEGFKGRHNEEGYEAFHEAIKSNQGCEGYQNNEGRAIQLSKVVMKGIRVNEALVQAPDPSL